MIFEISEVTDVLSSFYYGAFNNIRQEASRFEFINRRVASRCGN